MPPAAVAAFVALTNAGRMTEPPLDLMNRRAAGSGPHTRVPLKSTSLQDEGRGEREKREAQHKEG